MAAAPTSTPDQTAREWARKLAKLQREFNELEALADKRHGFWRAACDQLEAKRAQIGRELAAFGQWAASTEEPAPAVSSSAGDLAERDADDRWICRATSPARAWHGRSVHPDAVPRDSGSDERDAWKCPHCLLEFTTTVPQ